MPTAAVLGAGGQTGQECVKELVKKGFEVKAVVRSPSKYADTFSSVATAGPGKVDVVSGDVTNPASLSTALGGCDAGVIFAASGVGYFSAKSVDYQGVVNTVDAIKASNLPGPLVLVSSGLVSPHNRMHPIRIMLNNLKWGIMDQKFKGEEFIRGSGLKYTVVRPGRLNDGPGGEKTLLAQQGDTSAGSVARADVAAVCVAALTDPAAEKVTLELMSVDGAPGEEGEEVKKVVVPLADQLKGIFSGLKKD